MAALLARVYRRSTAGYVALFVGVLLGVCLLYTGAAVWIFARYFQREGADLGTFMLAGESGVLIGLIISAVVSQRRETKITDWLTGEGTGDLAVEAWNGLAGLPARLVGRSMLIIGGVTAPLLTIACIRAELDVVVLGMLLIGMVILNLGCASFALILLDIVLRPIRSEIDRALPSHFEPSYVSVGMNRRIMGELSLLIFGPAFLTAGLLAPPGGGAGAFVKAFLVGGAVAGLFAAVIGQALVERVAGPIRDLLLGTRAVIAGDLAVRVPLASTDEHLVLVDSFNRMVAGLRERQALHSAMGSYIDPAIAERVMVSGANIDGEAVEVTIMFVDIVGFTRLAEHAGPAEVVSELNDFFGPVIPAIVERGGHANKLLGDGLMAVFGIPIAMENHADRAFAAATDIQRRLVKRYDGRLRAGIGLNSGPVVAGSMGGGPKLDYTIIGDAVNVAARIEAQTRETGDAILLAESTKAALSAEFPLVHRGVRSLKGRASPIRLWAAPDVGLVAGGETSPAEVVRTD